MGCGSSKNGTVTLLVAEPLSWNVTREEDILEAPKKNAHICNVFDIEPCPSSYPEPNSQPSSKDKYLAGKDFNQIDKFATQAPEDLKDDYARLIEFCKRPSNDLDRVRTILVWLVKAYRPYLLKKSGPRQDEDNISLGGTSTKCSEMVSEQQAVTRVPSIGNLASVRNTDVTSNKSSGYVSPESENVQGRPSPDGFHQDVDNEIIRNSYTSSDRLRETERVKSVGHPASVSPNVNENHKSGTAERQNQEQNQEQLQTPKTDLEHVDEERVDLAAMFALICRMADIKCSIILGRCKTPQPQFAGSIVDGRWNGIFLDGVWRLIHPLWCILRFPVMARRDQEEMVIQNSKCNHQFDDYYFLTDPDQFVTRCFPDEERWQLLTNPLPDEIFKNMPYITESFHKLNLWMPEEQEGVMKTRNGRAKIKIFFPFNQQPQLYYYISSKEPESADDSRSPDDMDRALLRKCVFMYKTENFYQFKLRFNKVGKYVMQIHGHICTTVTSERDEAPLLCQFQFDCEDPDEEWRPIPCNPAIGWGQSAVAVHMGIVPVSHKHAVALDSGHGRVNLMFKLVAPLDLLAKFFDRETDELVLETDFIFKENKAILKIVLPQIKETYLRIYAKIADTSPIVNVYNLIIKTQPDSTERQSARDQRLRNNLNNAIQCGPEHELQVAIEEYEMVIHSDSGELNRAKDRLAFLRHKRKLREALHRNFVPLMQEAIDSAEQSKFREELQNDIRVVKAHLEKLQNSAPYGNHELPLNQNQMLKLRNIMEPNSVIHNVIIAALLLTGEKRKQINDWNYVRGMMARTGKDGILRAMEAFEPTRVDERTLQQVEQLWSRYSVEQVRETNAVAAAIHKWIKDAIDEIKAKRNMIASTSNDPS